MKLGWQSLQTFSLRAMGTPHWIAASLIVVAVLGSCGGGGGSGTRGAGQVTSPIPVPTPTQPPNPMFVRATGNDLNDGAAPATALRTIGHAVDIAVSGSTIVVGPGVYEEAVTAARAGANPEALMFIADSTGEQTGDGAGPVVVDATSTAAAAGFNLSTVRGGLIDGFTVTGGVRAGILIRNFSDNFVVQNCVVSGNGGDGIGIEDSASVLILNNLVYGNAGSGINVSGSVSGSPDNRIVSNTMTANDGPGLMIGSTSPRAFVRNNIVQENNGDDNIVAVSPSHTTYDGDFNLVSPGTYNPLGLQGANDVTDDASFRDPTTADYRLLANSPAIDKNSALHLTDSQQRLLRQRTTTGVGLDTGLLDFGYHFRRQR